MNSYFKIIKLSIYFFLLFGASLSQATVSGSSLFIGHRCANCHTIGRGKFVGPDLLNISNKYNREEIIEWATNPQLIYNRIGNMPINEGYPPMPPLNVDKYSAEKIADFLINFELKEGLSEFGSITGSVSNKYIGEIQGDVNIILISYLGDKVFERRFTKADSGGDFKFSGLRWDKSYEITVIYNNVEYVSGKMVFPPNLDLIDLKLPIYDTTGSDENIVLNSVQTVVYSSDLENHANIISIYEFINEGETIFIGFSDENEATENNKTVSFNIPNDAININFLNSVNSEAVIEADGKLYDTTAFHPGVKKYVISFDFPLKKLSSKLNFISDYKINNSALLIKKGEFDAEVKGLNYIGEVNVHNEKFLKYEGADMAAGEGALVIFSSKFDFTGYKRYFPFIIFIIFILSGLFYLNSKRNINKNVAIKNSDEKDILIKQISELDGLYEAGGIDEEQYRTRRLNLKAMLIDIYQDR